MEINREETNKYIEYMKKIEEYWQDQVDAGSWGRANLREVLASFKSLMEKISEDSVLFQSHKDELSAIIEDRMKAAVPREEEILSAEKKFSKEQIDAYEQAVEEYEQANHYGGNQAQVRLRKMIEYGYMKFFSPDELRKVFDGEGNFEQLNQKYPIIAQELNGLIKEIIKEKNSKEEK